MLWLSSVVLSLLAAAVSAQSSYTLPPGFNPAAVSANEKASWCDGQTNTCRELCTSSKENKCNPSSLQFSCVCQNGTVPDMVPYMNSLPYFVCQANFGQCIENNPNDATGQQTCKDDQSKCGTRNATEANGGSETTSATSSPTATETEASETGSEQTPSRTGSAPSTTTTNAAKALMFAKDYSLGALMTVFFVVFGFVV
ncbi:hypothetical protein FQN57_004645 [Myotisia sp. PD_48]|nr:hypothetical protein FQN57_004645 [Myotisia sp. PD_48]